MKRLLFLLLTVLCVQNIVQAQITYSQHVSVILYNNCLTCHRQGGLAPFKLETYGDAYIQRMAILNDVSKKIMPPWPPDLKYSRFAHERVLSDTDIKTIVSWVNNGAPEGDPALKPALPVFSTNSRLKQIDNSVRIPTYKVTSVTDDYRCFAIPFKSNASQYISAIEPIPGNNKIVHHILIYYDTTGACSKLDAADPLPGYAGFGGPGSANAVLIGAWVPGSSPVTYPDGFGVLAAKGGDIVLQIHYAPNSEGMSDSTTINFMYSTNASIRQVGLEPILNYYSNMVNGPLSIPANTVKSFKEKYTVPINVTVFGVAPHMHLIGTTIKAYGVTPKKDTIKLCNIKKWDFHWQGLYNFRKPVKIPAGTIVYAEATYDNTTANPTNPNTPPKLVNAGEFTTNEMMLVYFAYVYYQAGDENIPIDTIDKPLVTADIKPVNFKSDLNIFPNPTNGQLNIMLPGNVNGSCTIELYDIQGKLVKSFQENSPNKGSASIVINVEDLKNGFYYCRLLNGSNIISGKIEILR